jgi:hypothetical protein
MQSNKSSQKNKVGNRKAGTRNVNNNNQGIMSKKQFLAKSPAQRTQLMQPRQRGAAAAYSSSYSGNAPKITQTPKSCRVVHRELIASVTGTVAFTAGSQFELNPGIPATFPWLALMAQGWEQYEFNSLKFHYVTRTGTNVPGSVMLVPDYDAADAAPVDEATASSYQDCIEDAPWKDIVCVLRKSSMNVRQTRHFVRQVALAANLDIKTYDVGKFFILTVDGTAVPWGKLWVEYDVTFYIPQLPAAGAGPFGGGILSTGASETAANPFGTAPSVDAQAKGISMNTASVLVIENPGDYLIVADFVGTVISAVSAVVLGSGITLIGIAPTQLSIFDGGALNAQTRLAVRVTANTAANPASIAFALTATTITSGRVNVGQVPVGGTI